MLLHKAFSRSELQRLHVELFIIDYVNYVHEILQFYFFTGNLESAYDNAPEVFAERFSELIEAFKRDNQSDGLVMQCLLLKKMAEKQPEVIINLLICNVD
jgi:hypothetical protein